jgi:hypothetical protein
MVSVYINMADVSENNVYVSFWRCGCARLPQLLINRDLAIWLINRTSHIKIAPYRAERALDRRLSGPLQCLGVILYGLS